MMKRKYGARFLVIYLSVLLATGCSPVTIDSEDEKAYYDIYNSCYLTGNYVQAIVEFEQFIKTYPWSSKLDNGQYFLGRSHMKCAPNLSPDTLKMVTQYQSAITAFRLISNKSSKYDDGIKNIDKCRSEIAVLE